MSKIEVNAIEPQCGTNLTVGASGDTITFPSGTTVVNNGSQTGFGRTGTVDWDTTPKTASFTAVSGNGYFVDTSSGAVTATLPAGSAGDIVSFADYTRTFQTNNLTITPNGSEKIGGVAANLIASTEGQSITLIYVDGTEGWINTAESTGQSGLNPAFITATGGTITCCGDYKIHTFTGPGTFTVTCAGNPLGSSAVDYLAVAGGGGGGGYGGSGGGAGGFRLANSTCMPAPLTSPLANPTGVPVTAQGYPISVGGGGAAGQDNPGGPSCNGASGSNSVFSTITSAGGGGGRSFNSVGVAGGSGSGGRGGSSPGCLVNAGGAGNTPPVSPSQGNTGGSGYDGQVVNTNGGGGGGAGAVGTNAPPAGATGGAGGAGSYVLGTGFAGCNGTPGPVGSTRYFAGGGAGGACASPAFTLGGAGGGGNGGGTIGGPTGGLGTAGGTNTGGGGGGNGNCAPYGAGTPAGAGGSGIVIIRYKFQ